MADYSGTPLPAKLGITPASRVLVANAPDGWALTGSPAQVHRRASGRPYDVIVVFCPDSEALASRFEALTGRLSVAGALWVCWPKQASGVTTDLTDAVVREYGLASGLVDVKVAAIDSTWSGLKFVLRLRDR